MQNNLPKIHRLNSLGKDSVQTHKDTFIFIYVDMYHISKSKELEKMIIDYQYHRCQILYLIVYDGEEVNISEPPRLLLKYIQKCFECDILELEISIRVVQLTSLYERMRSQVLC